MSMQLSNITFYVLVLLERKKCVNLRNVCPSRGVVGFSRSRQRILQGEDKNSDGGLRSSNQMHFARKIARWLGQGVALRPPSELCLNIPC